MLTRTGFSLLLCLASAVLVRGQFIDIDAGVRGVARPAIAWGDYDQDGDLDFVLAGEDRGDKHALIFRNDNGEFTDIGAGLTGVHNGAVAWGDYDNDGDLDLVVSGETDSSRITHVYRNESRGFLLAANLVGVFASAVAWGDYDNDGDLDLLVAGATGTGGGTTVATLTRLYRNDAGTFVSVTTALPGVYLGSAAWGDYNRDGDLDILLTGNTGNGFPISRVYRNTGGTFSDANAGLPGCDLGNAAWGDYDQDGDLDIVLVGNGGNPGLARVYRNDDGNFVDINAGLGGVLWAWTGWGDMDADGDLDLAVMGYTGATPSLRLYRNDGGSFVLVNISLRALYLGQLAWGDYDADGRLDLLAAGAGDTNEGDFALIYRNVGEGTNAPPSRPMGLVARVYGPTLNLTWEASVDRETPSVSLSYNLRIGTNSGGLSVIAPQANLTNGFRLLPAFGSAQRGTNFTVTGLQPGRTYYCSVQAIDSGFAGSQFSEESAVVLPAPTAPMLMPVRRDAGGFRVQGIASPGWTYSILAASNATQNITNWTRTLTPTADQAGGFEVLDTQTNLPARYYRAVWP